MNKTIKRFFKTSGIFLIGNALSKIITFLLLPLYTNYISTTDYGYYDLSVTYVTVLTSMLYFDIWATALRFLYETQDQNKRNQIITICWFLFSISSVLFLGIGAIFCNKMSIAHGAMILGYGLSVNLYNMSSFMARGQEKNVDFVVSGIINTVFMVVSNLVMILGMHMDIEALYSSAIIGNLAQFAYLSIRASVLPKLQGFQFNQILLREIVHYTLPLCVNSVSYWFLTSYNRTIVEDIMGLSANGIYAIGNKFGAAISIVTTCFIYAWQSIAFARQKDSKADGAFYGKASGQYFLFLGLGVAGLLPFFHITFPLLIGKSYADAYDTIPIFLIMAVLSACSTFVGNIFYAIKDTRSIFSSMIISSLCNILLCRFLVVRFGINGANASICISFALNIGIRYLILARRIAIKHNRWHYLIPLIVISIATAVYTSKLLILNIALIFGMVVAIIIVLFWLRKKQVERVSA